MATIRIAVVEDEQEHAWAIPRLWYKEHKKYSCQIWRYGELFCGERNLSRKDQLQSALDVELARTLSYPAAFRVKTESFHVSCRLGSFFLLYYKS